MKVTCSNCGKEFNKKLSTIGKHTFCSRECCNFFKSSKFIKFIEQYKLTGDLKKSKDISSVSSRSAYSLFIENNLWEFSKCKYCGDLVNRDKSLSVLVNVCDKCIPIFKKNKSEALKKTCKERYGVESPFKIDGIKDKIKEVVKERYGVDNVFQASKIKDKIKETNSEKYGVANPSQSDIIKEKKKQTSLKNYGVTSPLKSKEILDKLKKTNFEKYGVECAIQNKEVQKKREKTNIERYGSKTSLENKDVIQKRKETNKIKYGSENVSSNEEVNKKMIYAKKINFWEEFLERLKNKDLIPLFTKEDYLNKTKDQFLKYECKSCGRVNEIYSTHPQRIHCNCNFRKSKYEKEIRSWLESIGVYNIIPNKKFYENKRQKFEIDVYLPDYNFGIEFHGLFWHNSLVYDSDYHQDKYFYFKNKGINLIQIFENEWIDKKDVIKSIIKDMIGFNVNIMSHEYDIHEISKEESNLFLKDNNLQENFDSNIGIGLFYNNELMSTCLFKKGTENKDELISYSNKVNVSIFNDLLEIIKYYESNYKPKEIISFVDLRYYNSDKYIKSKFTCKKILSPNYFYFDKHQLKLYNKDFFINETSIPINYLKISDAGKIELVRNCLN